MESQHRKFSTSWFLLFRSQKARADLDDDCYRIVLLNADVDVGGLAEKSYHQSLTNYSVCTTKSSSGSRRIHPNLPLSQRTPSLLSQCSLSLTCKQRTGLVNQQISRKGYVRRQGVVGLGLSNLVKHAEATRTWLKFS